jgi:hypothetical protein
MDSSQVAPDLGNDDDKHHNMPHERGNESKMRCLLYIQHSYITICQRLYVTGVGVPDSLILQSVLRSAIAVPPCLCLATMSLLHLGSSASCKKISIWVLVPLQSMQAANWRNLLCRLPIGSSEPSCDFLLLPQCPTLGTGNPVCSFARCSTASDVVAWSLMSSVASKPSLDDCRVHHQDLLPVCRPTPRRSNCQPGDQHTHHSAQLTDKIVHYTFALSRRYCYVRGFCDHADCSRMRMITLDLAPCRSSLLSAAGCAANLLYPKRGAAADQV